MNPILAKLHERVHMLDEHFTHDDIQVCLNAIDDLQTGCQLALDFHSGRQWDDAEYDRWQEQTGTKETSAKILCDTIRRLKNEH